MPSMYKFAVGIPITAENEAALSDIAENDYGSDYEDFSVPEFMEEMLMRAFNYRHNSVSTSVPEVIVVQIDG